MEMAFTGVIVLGAGFGSRFGGKDKLGVLLAGKPVAHHVLSALRPFDWAKKILVCRSLTEWSNAFRDDGFDIVRNDNPEQGMLGSLRRGVLGAQGLRNVLVCLADMPFTGSDHIARLLSAAQHTNDRIVASRANEYHGPPAIFPVSELRRLPRNGEGGARSLLALASFIDCDVGQLLDIDTRQDLDTVEAHLSAAGLT